MLVHFFVHLHCKIHIRLSLFRGIATENKGQLIVLCSLGLFHYRFNFAKHIAFSLNFVLFVFAVRATIITVLDCVVSFVKHVVDSFK